MLQKAGNFMQNWGSKELKIWWKLTNNSFQQTLNNKVMVAFLLLGKLVRIGLFLAFLTFLFRGANSLAGYTPEQVILFYLTFNLIDSTTQMLFREVYRFRQLVISGNLDLVLVKPYNPLVRVLLGGADLMDLLILGLIISSLVFFTVTRLHPPLVNWLLYALLILNGLIIATAIHIIVLGIGVITTAVDHLIMVYRDFNNMLRIPVDLYVEPIRFFLIFVIPLGIMVSFPAKALLGLLSTQNILLGFLIGSAILVISLKFWQYSLKLYSSASS